MTDSAAASTQLDSWVLKNLYGSFVRDPLLQGFYGESGYMNLGYWADDVTDATQAGDALVDRVIELLGDATPGRILDVACGQGATSARIAQHFPESSVTGINISESELDAATARAPHVAFASMDAVAMTFPDDHFDAVVCVEAAFHFRTRRAFLAEALRVLRPGGQLAMFDLLFTSGVPSIPGENLLADRAAYESELAKGGWTDISTRSERADTLERYQLRFSDHITANTSLAGWLTASRNLLYTNVVLGTLISDCLFIHATKSGQAPDSACVLP